MKREIMVVALLVVLVIGYKIGSRHDRKSTSDAMVSEVKDNMIAKGLKEEVVIKGSRLVKAKREGSEKFHVEQRQSPQITVEEEYVAPEGQVTIEIGTKGEVKVINKTKGLSLEPQAICTTNRIGLGARVAYYKRFGVSFGCTVSMTGKDIRPYICIDMRIRKIVPLIKNMGVGVMYDGDVKAVISLYL